MLLSRSEAERDNVVVPLTLEDYCIKTKVKPDTEHVDMADFYDDDYDIDDDDDDDDEDLSENGNVFSFLFVITNLIQFINNEMINVDLAICIFKINFPNYSTIKT